MLNILTERKKNKHKNKDSGEYSKKTSYKI